MGHDWWEYERHEREVAEDAGGVGMDNRVIHFVLRRVESDP